jgi:RHS repeat-associated protein
VTSSAKASPASCRSPTSTPLGGERLSQTKHNSGGTTEESFYGYNPHSDVETLTDQNGDTRATYGYTAYGQNDDTSFTGVDKPNPADPTKEPYNFYRFNAKRFDPASGTYDMGFRDYDPGLNRFLSRDSYNGALADLDLSTDPFTSNRYAFAGGNPISNVELDGHRPADCDAECMREWSKAQTEATQRNLQVAAAAISGFGALYDRNGKLVNETDLLRSGGPKGRDFTRHIERQVLSRYQQAGMLEEGSTVVIVTDTKKPVCVPCKNAINKLFRELKVKIRIIYRAPGGHEETFGEASAKVALEGGGITPEGKFPHLRNVQGRLPMEGGPRGGAPREPGGGGIARFGGKLFGLLMVAGEIAGLIDQWQNPDRYKMSPYQSHCNMLGEPVFTGAEEMFGECQAGNPNLA